jgi:hypothetical protein
MNPMKPFIIVLIVVTLYILLSDDDYHKSLDTPVQVRYN